MVPNSATGYVQSSYENCESHLVPGSLTELEPSCRLYSGRADGRRETLNKQTLAATVSAIAIFQAAPSLAQEMNDAPDAAGKPAEDGSTAEPSNVIIVTANRKEERLQDVGISITALTGNELAERGIENAGDLAEITPNVQMIRSFATPGFNTQVTIRGIGQPNFEDTTEATSPTYVDEFYMIGAGQADFGLYDLARTEVARGPQGTVQGRNSTAGSINFYTRRPEFFGPSASLSVSAGEHNLFRSTGFLNVPLSDTVAVRGSFNIDRNDGYIKNINPDRLYDRGGQNKFYAGRLQVAFEPTDAFSLNLKAEVGEVGPVAAGNERPYFTAAGPGVGTIAVSQDAFGNTLENNGIADDLDLVNADGALEARNKVKHFLANASYEASNDLTLVAVAGILEMDKYSIEDCDHTPDPVCLFTNQGDSEHEMAELRGLYSLGRSEITVGASYLHQDLNVRSVTPLFFNAEITPFVDTEGNPTGLYTQSYRDSQVLKSWAIFGQVEHDLGGGLEVIAGARYTRDDKEIDALNQVSVNVPLTFDLPRSLAEFNAIGDYVFANPDVTTSLNTTEHGELARFDKGLISLNLQLNYQPNPDLLLYAAYRRGTKSGGFITGNATGVAPELREYGAETNNAYEVGAKTTFFGGLASLNGAIFYYDYQDMQNTSFIGITNVVTNNDATIVGGEIEFSAQPLEGLQVSAGAGLLDTEVNDITNPTGRDLFTGDVRLPMAPSFTANGLVRYEFDWGKWTAFAQVDGNTRSEMFRDSLNNPSTLIPGNTEVNARIGLGDSRDDWRLSLWVNNLFDSRKPVNKFDLSGVGNSGEIVYQLPRWFGATLTVNFGS